MTNKLLLTTFLVCIQTIAFAVTKTYVGAASGSWNTAANWSPSGIPTGSDDVVIPSGKTVTVTLDSFANTISLSGALTISDAKQLTVYYNFTVNAGGSFYMPGGSGLAILVVYGNYYNNGSTDFWKSTTVIAGDLISPSTSTIQNNGNVVVGGNIIGSFDTTGGSGTSQIYAPNPAATVTITPTSIDDNVIPGTAVVHPPETQVLVDLVNLVLYGNTCSYSNSTANVTVCSGSTAVLTAITTASSPTFQWQVNKSDGTGWNNLSNSAPYSGVTTSTLTITTATTAMDNYKYRAQVTAGGCAKFGSHGTLTVNTSPSSPTIGTITRATCSLSNGSVILGGLPSSGTWTLTRSGTSSGTATGTGTSTTISGLATGTYTFTVSNGTCTSSASSSAVLTTLTNTWNGSVWSTGSLPTGSENIVINGNYTPTSNLIGCSMTIASGNVLINSPYSITLGNAVTVSSGSLTIKSGGSLIQTDDTSVNTGNIIIERLTTIRKTDYVYWSAPVAGFSSASICPTSYIYKWNPSVANSNGGQGNWQAGSETMSVGKGYIARGPDTYTATAAAFTASFTGIPNNGIIQPAITRGNIASSFTGINGATINYYDDNWNLIGNPYPSAISATAFLSANTNIAGNVRVWTHGTALSLGGSTFYGSFAYNYNTNDYVNYNGVGSTPPGFNGKIASGQSFFVCMNESTAVTESVTFNNSMRSSSYSNTQFYRTTTPIVYEQPSVNRIWLSLVNSNNTAATTLIGYVDGATYGKDRLFDAVQPVVSTSSSIYSMLNSEAMIIQGRPTPFDSADLVPLGINISADGTYSIAISQLDGLFDNVSQDIYLQDMITGSSSNLRTAPYTFSATAGTYNNRFVLRYNNTMLGVSTAGAIANQTFAFVSNHHLMIQSDESIEQVEVYDIAGQLLMASKAGNSSNKFESDFNYSKGIYLSKILLEDGIIVSRKFIN